jgi:hypothetical protein
MLKMSSFLYYLFIFLALFTIGDIVSVITRARLSGIFVTLMLFTIGFMTHIIPADIVKQAGLGEITVWASAFLVFHMGTLVNLRELAKEWRSCALSIVAMIATFAAILACIPIVGREAAIVSIPVMKGGALATQIITSGAMSKGMPLAAAFAALVYAIHKFVATPICSYSGLREAEDIVRPYREGKLSFAALNAAEEEACALAVKPLYVQIGLEKYFTEFTCLGVTAMFSWFAIVLDKNTGLSYTIWALLLGATVGHFQLVPERILDRAKTTGFMTMVNFAIIIPAMSYISINDFLSFLWQMGVLFVATLISTYLCFWYLPFWKIVGSRHLAIGITMANMLGFPATWLIANEIANAVAQNEDEKKLILRKIMPAYVVAGFTTVTILSIIIAGICVKYL